MDMQEVITPAFLFFNAFHFRISYKILNLVEQIIKTLTMRYNYPRRYYQEAPIPTSPEIARYHRRRNRRARIARVLDVIIDLLTGAFFSRKPRF